MSAPQEKLSILYSDLNYLKSELTELEQQLPKIRIPRDREIFKGRISDKKKAIAKKEADIKQVSNELQFILPLT